MTDVAPTSQPLALRPDVVATVLDDGAVLLDLDTKFFYVANHTGWAIARMFEDGTTIDRVRQQCAANGAPAGDPAVDAAIDLLVADGLVTTAGEDAAADLDVGEPWVTPTILKQAEPLQRVIVSAFDPSVPLAE